MNGFTVRPTVFDDIDIVHGLITEQNKLDFGDPLRSLDDTRHAWQASDFNLELDSRVALAPDGQIAGYAELRGGEDAFVYLGPQHQNTELAIQLLGFLEDRARSQKADGKSVELWGRAGYRNPSLINAFDKNGFLSDFSFLVMEIVMTEPPKNPTWPNEVSVRTFVVNQDEQETYQVDEEAAKDKGYHDPLSYENWSKRMGMDKKTFDPKAWFIACKKDKIVGVALNVTKENTGSGWVDHLSVLRAWRNKGIGKALLLHTFGEFYKRGIHTVKLSVDSKSLTNAPHLYESVGMKTVEKYHVYKKVI